MLNTASTSATTFFAVIFSRYTRLLMIAMMIILLAAMVGSAMVAEMVLRDISLEMLQPKFGTPINIPMAISFFVNRSGCSAFIRSITRDVINAKIYMMEMNMLLSSEGKSLEKRLLKNSMPAELMSRIISIGILPEWLDWFDIIRYMANRRMTMPTLCTIEGISPQTSMDKKRHGRKPRRVKNVATPSPLR